MDVTEAIETRIEVREYADDPIEPETIRAILDAGRLASSGRNTQHWRFLLLDDEEELAAVAAASPTGSWVADAAFAVVVCTDPRYDFHEIDAGRAVTYMQLAAWAAGVGSCIYTVDNPALAESLAIPNDYALTLVAGFGTPAEEVRGVKDREPLSAVAFRGRFGEPLED